VALNSVLFVYLPLLQWPAIATALIVMAWWSMRRYRRRKPA
jgi:hypothetical protein